MDIDIGNNTIGCEFGYELIMVLPYVHYLKTQGIPIRVLTAKGMRSLYFFLNDDEYVEKYSERGWYVPNNTPLKNVHFHQLNKEKWSLPDYKKFYSKQALPGNLSDKELFFINNKYSYEWAQPPINFINVETLDVIFQKLINKYTIIYNRPDYSAIPDDHAKYWPEVKLLDHELIKDKYPSVINFNDLVQSDNRDFNQLQLIVGAHTKHKVSVQGGLSILASLTGGTNTILAKKGSELYFNSYNWYSEFSGAKVRATSNDNELIQWVINMTT
jgi:hypothetical protein